jgi:hypothetical protein
MFTESNWLWVFRRRPVRRIEIGVSIVLAGFAGGVRDAGFGGSPGRGLVPGCRRVR